MDISKLAFPHKPAACGFLLLASAIGSFVEPAAAQSLRASLGQHRLEIGVLDGAPEYVFGQIADVAGLPSGQILVLDAQYRRLTMFSADGNFLARVGRAGRGPGEFIAPVALAVNGNEVLVLDVGQARVHAFQLAEKSLEFSGSIPVPASTRSMCAMTGFLIAFGYQRGHMVHVLTRAGEPVRWFGQPFHSDPVVAQLATNGKVECIEGEVPGVIVFPTNFPTVYAYNLDGTARWSAKLPGFDGGMIRRGPSGIGVAYGAAADGGPSDLGVSAVVVGERLLVQWGEAFQGMSSIEDITSVTSAVIDLDSGHILEVLRDMPRLNVATADRLFSHANDPFPRLRVFASPSN